MFKDSKALNVLGVDDVAKAKEFYIKTLGLTNIGSGLGELMLDLGDSKSMMVYPDENHKAASSAVLTFQVDDIDDAVDQLTKAGVAINREDAIVEPDEKGIVRNLADGKGPDVALFKDPAGNILSVLQGA